MVLLDCRLPPQQADRDMVSFALSRNLPVLAVLTKADKCSQREREARRREWAIFLRGAAPLPVSAKSGMGMTKLWDMLRGAAGAASAPSSGEGPLPERDVPQADAAEDVPHA